MHMLKEWEKRSCGNRFWFLPVSRLYLYVHYPTDVLGGVLAGAISGYLGYRFIQAIFYRIKQEGGGPCPK